MRGRLPQGKEDGRSKMADGAQSNVIFASK
jgi:hypothetical protein